MSVPQKKTEEKTSKKNQFAFLKEIVNYNVGIIQYLDQKTHLLLGTLSILIPLTIGLFNATDLDTNSIEVILGAIGYSLTLFILFLSLIFSISVIIARTPSAPKTLFFGLDIIEESRDKFKEKVKSFSFDQQINDLSNQAYTLGSILKPKFRFYNIALFLLFIGVEMLILSFIAVKNSILAISFGLLLVFFQGGFYIYLLKKKV